MSAGRTLAIFGTVTLAVSVPFAAVHFLAAPDDALITPLQRVVAILANYFGPWGVAIVRVVDFPNAGLRSFSWGMAAGLSVIGAVLLLLPLKIRHRPSQIVLSVLWGCFVVIWFGVGLRQIADGLL
jgi:hypothetical protein